MGKTEGTGKGVNLRRRREAEERPSPYVFSDDFPSALSALLEDMRSEVVGKGEAVQKFLGLTGALEEVVPDEERRHEAAMKALFHATGLSGEDLLAAADRQLAEIKRQKESFALTADRWRRDLGEHFSRAREIREEMEALRRRLSELEEEQKAASSGLRRGEKEISDAEARFASEARELQAGIEGVISSIRSVVSGKALRVRPPEAAKASGPREGGDTALTESDNRRICSNCKCPMDWHEMGKVWKCFVCASEEV
ncbi:MAG: hypothetical protein Kow0025_16050 [Thermodesulfovibrionales bacterium]